MKILLAIDGSESAERAANVVRNVAWPTGSAARIVSVVRPVVDASLGIPGVVTSAETMDRLLEAAVTEARRVVGLLATGLRAHGLTVEESVVEGRPASVIVELAGEFHPDLILVGSHGRGRVASMVLGSVSAEVVESAPCSVLVVRSDAISRLILADDSSPSAAVGSQLVEHMPGFHGLPVRVVTVEDRTPAWYGWLGAQSADGIQAFEDAIAADRQARVATAAKDVTALKAAGLVADSTVRQGDPGHEIVAAAKDFNADLIVMGTRGQTGLTRLLLGSVARKVLQQAHCSVLVVRRAAG
jgi:nucleotide-binding universal stress UspA family protein